MFTGIIFEMIMKVAESNLFVPRAELRTVGDVNRLVAPPEFEGYVDIDLRYMGENKPLSELHKYSGALRDQRFLYEIGFRQAIGEKLDLPEDVLKAGNLVYTLFNVIGRGNAANDACDYDNGDRSLRKRKYRSVRWVVNPAGFNDNGEIQINEDPEKRPVSEIYNSLVPSSGFGVVTMDGMARPDTGTPFATGTRKQALKSIIKSGVPEEHAEKFLYYFSSREYGQGKAAVSRWYYDDHYGSFIVYADNEPRVRSPVLCSFLVSRL